ncbi:MAG TPA: hypothetical protein DDZ88_17140 [Verrucomicrobiales bacterium]|nr:hypothetical protein [Verrucomicrobiales bacterium]
MKFVPVPIGGGPTNGQRVLFSIWDTRVEDYLKFARANKVDGRWQEQQMDGVPVGRELDHPVVGVNWEDAQAFCQWLTAKETAEGKLPPGMEYRLPSDEEWSWAVGLPTEPGATPAEKTDKNTVDFPWGIGYPPPGKLGNYADETFHAKFPKHWKDRERDLPWIKGYNDGYATTSPVGSFPANAHGLHDMGGNVWQWCEDWFDKDQKQRVRRGASWDAGDRGTLQSSHRRPSAPKERGYDHGFRCVLAASVDTASPSLSLPVSESAATPDTASKDASFTNSLGMKLVPVPGTKVLFCIHEARYQDYAAYAAETPGIDNTWKDQSVRGFVSTENREQHPVMKIGWEDAQKFCAWLSRKEGRTYRLPTDEEWSIAVGLGPEEKQRPQGATPAMLSLKENSLFPWGGVFPPKTGDKAGNYSDASRKARAPDVNTKYLEDYDDGFPTTAPVMSFKPNELGLYDMGGNVWEWCVDWYDATQKERMLRGGSWEDPGREVLLSSNRRRTRPDHRPPSFGFRVVLVPESAPAPKSQASASAPAPAATKEHPFINTLGMKFVPVPITGGPTDGKRVLFSIWDTRGQDYEVFVRDTNRQWPGADFPQISTHPAVGVSWNDAHAFCVWLTKHEHQLGRLGVNDFYRLPSDHEWSCAVGIGEREDAYKLPFEKSQKISDAFPWGVQWPPPQGAGNYAGTELQPALAAGEFNYVKGFMNGYSDGFVNTSPVGSFAANQFGIYDLGGNVQQYCEDWLDNKHQERVLRGGSWAFFDRNNMLSSSRSRVSPGDGRFGRNGFRCVLESSVQNVSPSPSLPVSSSSTAATKDAPFTNTLGMKFVPVPGTNILMGIHETRRQDYRVYADAVPGTDATWKAPVVDGKPLVQGEDHPVVHVSWDDATAFCKWLGNKEGRTYRLPTEHEWNLAVAIGVENPREISPTELHTRIKDAYPWPTPALAGNQLRSDQNKEAHYAAQTEGFKHGNYRGITDGYEVTSPVMSFLPNHLGIYDLGGNVWEWCAAPTHASGNTQPLRGSGFRNYSWGIVADSRTHINRDARIAPQPDGSLRDFGFRVVLELPKQP